MFGVITEAELFAHLEKHPSDVNGYDPSIYEHAGLHLTLTMMACTARTDLLPTVLAFRPDLEATSDSGTALAQAVVNGKSTCALMLVAHGASPDSVLGDAAFAPRCPSDLRFKLLAEHARYCNGQRAQATPPASPAPPAPPAPPLPLPPAAIAAGPVAQPLPLPPAEECPAPLPQLD